MFVTGFESILGDPEFEVAMLFDEDAIVTSFVKQIDLAERRGMAGAVCGRVDTGTGPVGIGGVIASLVPCLHAIKGRSEVAIMFDTETFRASGRNAFYPSPDATRQTGKTRCGELLTDQMPGKYRAKNIFDFKASKASALATVANTARGAFAQTKTRLDGHFERPQQVMKVMSYETVVAE